MHNGVPAHADSPAGRVIDGYQEQPPISLDALFRLRIGYEQRSTHAFSGELQHLFRRMGADVDQTFVEILGNHWKVQSSIESDVNMSTYQRLTRERAGSLPLSVLWWVAVTMAVACGTPSPSLVFAEGTPADLQELGQEVWGEFLAVFPNQAQCIGEVTLEGDWTLEGSRAYYLPDSAKVGLKIPGTAAHLRHSLVHELAHHLEHACPDHGELRAAFLKAQNLPPGTPWFEGPSWEATPSEQYAEAVVRLVLSRPVKYYRLVLTPEAIGTVLDWGGSH